METPNDNDNTSSTDRQIANQSISSTNQQIANQSIIIATLIVAVAILGGLWFMSRSETPPTVTPTVTSTAETAQDWPAVPPTFTHTPTATMTGTPAPTATSAPTHTPTPTFTPSPMPTPTPIVVGWRELGHLTSVEFTVTTVVDLEKESSWWWPKDSILIMAVGQVEASVDLTQIKDADVEIEANKVKLVLPHASISSIELVLDETRILRKDGWFPGEGLEVEALNQAQTQIKDWATTQGNLIDIAEKLAKAQLENFLRKLGFDDVEITFKEKGDL